MCFAGMGGDHRFLSYFGSASVDFLPFFSTSPRRLLSFPFSSRSWSSVMSGPISRLLAGRGFRGAPRNGRHQSGTHGGGWRRA